MTINKEYPCNPSYYSNRTSKVEYIVIHYTGCIAPAVNFCKNSQRAGGRDASAHYFVGYEGEVFQSVPEDKRAWHCGAKTYKHPACRNDNSIGIEMCTKNPKGSINSTSGWYFEDATIQATAQLTRELMRKYNIPEDRVVRHYDVTGKICPAPYVNEAEWLTFKTLLREDNRLTQEQFNKMMDAYLAELRAGSPSSWSKDARDWVEGEGILKGDTDGNMMYRKYLTREELAQVLFNINQKENK